MVNKEAYESSESFRGSEEIGIKEIALNRYNVALKEGSKEMTRGGLQTRIIEGMPVRIIVSNQCEVFINSVQMLHNVIFPMITKCNDKTIKTKFDDINTRLDEANKLHNEALKKNYSEHKNKMRSGNIMISGDATTSYNQGIERLERNFEQYNINIHKELLLIISRLLNDLDYFGEGDVGG